MTAQFARSSWSSKSLPHRYVVPFDERPEIDVPICKEIPVIDMGNSADLAQKMVEAAQEFGIFQVINHGISEKLMAETMGVCKEFFDMPAEEKAKQFVNNKLKSNYSNENFNFWKETLRHLCPLENHISSWPQSPAAYRKIAGEYSVEVRKLSIKILELLCEGLGVEEENSVKEIMRTQLMQANHYPKCPDPTLSLGLGGHCDPNIITLLQQDLEGLQFLKDGKWLGVEVIPNAFVINIGLTLKVVSNGKVISGAHRVVTNSTCGRTTIGTFIGSGDHIIEPAKSLISPSKPPLYRAFQYEELVRNNSFSEAALDSFKVPVA